MHFTMININKVADFCRCLWNITFANSRYSYFIETADIIYVIVLFRIFYNHLYKKNMKNGKCWSNNSNKQIGFTYQTVCWSELHTPVWKLLRFCLWLHMGYGTTISPFILTNFCFRFQISSNLSLCPSDCYPTNRCGRRKPPSPLKDYTFLTPFIIQ